MSDGQATLAPGMLLAGKYKIEQMLGEGGMGAVFLAENTDIGRKVAIKVLHADFAKNEQLMLRFRQEARAATAIGHPGIVDILDMGQTADGAAFIVMERLDGDTLGGRLKKLGRLGAGEAARVVADVCEALAAAHAKGIIHRDLKPDNVFLVERPVAITKILDFGISKLQGSEDVALTRTGTVMGTPLYMSPEQARGAKDVGPPTDLYAVGCILYHALTGAPPFTGESYNEVLANVLMEDARPVRELRPGLPRSFYELIDQLIAKEAKVRPDARSAAQALRRVAGEITTDMAAVDRTMAIGDERTAPGKAPSAVAGGAHVGTVAVAVEAAARKTGTIVEFGGAHAAPSQAPVAVETQMAPLARSRRGLWIGVGVAVATIGIGAIVIGGGK
jgi:serine/threonine-protein kinase